MSIVVRKEIIELAEKMVKYKLARSRSHALNILIEKGLSEAKKDVEFWEQVYRDVEDLGKIGVKITHCGLNRLLKEERRLTHIIQKYESQIIGNNVSTLLRQALSKD